MYAAHNAVVHQSPVVYPHDLAIIGDGATASTILIRLARDVKDNGPQSPLRSRIHTFGRNGFPSGGIAYGQCSEHHLLNSVRSEMSPWEPDAFHNYCVERWLGGLKTDFNKRIHYLDFLKQEVGKAVDILRKAGADFIHHPHEAAIHTGWQNRYFICDQKNGNILLTGVKPEQIVIAAGYGPNRNFQTVADRGIEGYAASPYDAVVRNALPGLRGKNPHIVFLGCGPALYDFVNDLHGHGIEHAKLTVITKSHAAPLNIRDVSVEENEQRIVPNTLLSICSSCCAEDLRTAIMTDFSQAATQRRGALDVLKNLRPVLRRMDPFEAGSFQRSPFLGWLKHTATPVPQESQTRLLAFNPNFIRATITDDDIKQTAKGRISIRHNDIKIEDADLVVNGTGHGRHNAPIFEQLKKDRLAYVDDTLDVLKTDETGYSLLGSGIACIEPSIHHGCDGIESFDQYAQAYVKNLALHARSEAPSHSLAW